MARSGWVVAIAAVMALASCGSAGGNGASAGSSSAGNGGNGGSGQTQAATCNLPVVNDTYDGYKIGVPSGWNLSRYGGTLVVSKDTAGTIEAVMEPAVLTNALTPASFFSTATSQLQQAAAAGGNSLSFQVTSNNGGLTQATVSGHNGGANVNVTGHAGVALLPYKTAYGSQLVVFSAYWAPQADLASEMTSLAGFGPCYQPEQGTLFQVVMDQEFTYPIPLGWTPSEQPNTLFVEDPGNDASADYVNYEILTPSQGVTDASSLLQYFFSQEHITVGTILSTSTAQPTTTVTGGVQEGKRIEFTGTVNGAPCHAIASVEAVTFSGIDTSGAIRLAIAHTERWNEVSGALLQIAGGIQHKFTQDLAQLRRLSLEWQAFNQQVAGFDSTLNGLDLVRDPSTGGTFEVPYSDYDPNGPEGPGYYVGPPGMETKLTILTP